MSSVLAHESSCLVFSGVNPLSRRFVVMTCVIIPVCFCSLSLHDFSLSI
jgi:hypothetical protein